MGGSSLGRRPSWRSFREAQEEAAVEIELGRIVCTREWADGFVLHVFTATIVGGEPQAPPGIREVGWFDVEQLPCPRSRALETLPDVLAARRGSARSGSL